jgi:hypothetical protein
MTRLRYYFPNIDRTFWWIKHNFLIDPQYILRFNLYAKEFSKVSSSHSLII